MRKFNFHRSLGAALALTLAMGTLPNPGLALEADGLCPHHTAHTENCGYSSDTDCRFLTLGCEDCEQLTPIIGTDVLIDGHSFPYTGHEIRPAITVTVNGNRLTEGEHYELSYENNVEPGEASVTVTGLEEGGYQGIVTIVFTITPAAQPEETQPEETQPEETQPEETQPEETQPEETQKPEEDETPQETKPVEYKITKGNGSTWYQGSGKTLSFTVSGSNQDLKELLVNGKILGKEFYTLGQDSQITLNKNYLNRLTVGKYNLTIRFADGEAAGTFTVSDRLDTTNPVTGHDAHPGLWVIFGSGSLALLGGMMLLLGRKKRT